MHVQGNVHVILGAGSNVTVQLGNLGAILVDTGTAQNADARAGVAPAADDRGRFATSSTRIRMPITSAATSGSARRERRSPVAASPWSAPAPARAPRSSRTRRR